MKIYIDELKINKFNFNYIYNTLCNDQNNIIINEYLEKKIYSEDRIIEIDNNGILWNIDTIEHIPLHYNINVNINNIQQKIKLIIDKSKFKKNKQIFQINPKHFIIITRKITFKYNDKNNIYFVIELNEKDNKDDLKISDVYFEIENNFDSIEIIKNYIVTFFSLINFINYI